MSRMISTVVCLVLASSTVFGQAPKKDVAERTAGEAKELAPGMVFHWCPPGTFTMGSSESELGIFEFHPSDEDQVKVRLSKGFWLGETEVTQGQWLKLMGTSPWKEDSSLKEGSSYPATYISHDDAVAFVKKLTDQERHAGRLAAGWHYALPTEAQWEYACRAGTTTKYSFGNSESDLGGWLDTALVLSGTALCFSKLPNDVTQSMSRNAKKVAPRRYQSSVKPEHSQRFSRRCHGSFRPRNLNDASSSESHR
jgi:formylglycine-generating enzyme required for sulfatase activity